MVNLRNLVPIAQWIERNFAEVEMRVRILLGTHSLYSMQTKIRPDIHRDGFSIV